MEEVAYIVTQIRGGLVLIDQHNSHERILYNEAQKALEEQGGQPGVPTQQLLFPAHLELTPGQVQAWQTHADQLDGGEALPQEQPGQEGCPRDGAGPPGSAERERISDQIRAAMGIRLNRGALRSR